MRPFRFGQSGTPGVETRLAIEFDPAEDDAALPFRCTVPVSITRNLAAHLAETAGVADGWRPPHHVRVSMPTDTDPTRAAGGAKPPAALLRRAGSATGVRQSSEDDRLPPVGVRTYDGLVTNTSPASPERTRAAAAADPAADPSDVARAEVARLLEEVDQHDAAEAQAAAAAKATRERLFEAITDFVDVARPAEHARLARRLWSNYAPNCDHTQAWTN